MQFVLLAAAETVTPDQTAAAAGCSIFGLFMLAIFSIVGLFIYLVPTYVAVARKHPNMPAIILLNVFLGWTLVGWVGALVWSFTNTAPPTIEIRQYRKKSKRRRDEDDYED